ncbi:MAG: mannose-1-phosphate guanylyltransferase [FCB group bacterium]|nr:mannose-1-phosphate guanylyltransferase [FCB group bacterium]
MIHSVIMAGGIGSRFWPMSRRAKPKHLLPLINSTPLIEATINRIKPLTPDGWISIVTNEYQKRRIQEILPDLQDHNFITEPFGRNTAPCIGLSAVNIRHQDPKAVMIVLPADHIIDDDESFRTCLTKAVGVASEGKSLVTIGIPPTRIETGYGYIQRNAVIDAQDKVYQVKTFAEKPNYETAQRFIESGDFYWNSGIFIWRVDLILDYYRKFLPDLYVQLCDVEKHLGKESYRKNLRRVYKSTKNISIDYGIMERAPSVNVIEGHFGWGDIGSWEEAFRRSKKDPDNNAAVGEHIFYKSSECYVNSPKKFVAVVGMKDVIIVESGNALLVCDRSRAQDVKEVVEKLERDNAKRLL